MHFYFNVAHPSQVSAPTDEESVRGDELSPHKIVRSDTLIHIFTFTLPSTKELMISSIFYHYLCQMLRKLRQISPQHKNEITAAQLLSILVPLQKAI